LTMLLEVETTSPPIQAQCSAGVNGQVARPHRLSVPPWNTCAYQPEPVEPLQKADWIGVATALRMYLVSLSRRAHQAIERERNEAVANRCAHIGIEWVGYDSGVKPTLCANADGATLAVLIRDTQYRHDLELNPGSRLSQQSRLPARRVLVAQRARCSDLDIVRKALQRCGAQRPDARLS
jgi:hypothetical protein